MSEHRLDAGQRDIRALARRFADTEIAPRAVQRARAGALPGDVLAHLGELGLAGVCVPQAHGGAGADYLSHCLVVEEISRVDPGVGALLAVHTGAGTMPILAHGDPEQIGRLVPPLAQGHELAAFALTGTADRPGAAAPSVHADEDGRLTGTVGGVGNGNRARTFVVIAQDARAGGRASAFVVRRGAAGFGALREEQPSGSCCSSTAGLAFDATPAEALGFPGAGLRIARTALDGARIGLAAQAVGIARAALERAAAATDGGRRGGPIPADMRTRIEAARALVWRAARLRDAGRPHAVEGAQAERFARAVARHRAGGAIEQPGGG